MIVVRNSLSKEEQRRKLLEGIITKMKMRVNEIVEPKGGLSEGLNDNKGGSASW